MTTRNRALGRDSTTRGNGLRAGIHALGFRARAGAFRTARRNKKSWDPGVEVAGLPLPTHEVPATFGTPVERDQASLYRCLSTTGRHVTLASCWAPKLSHPHADARPLLQRPCQAGGGSAQRSNNLRNHLLNMKLRNRHLGGSICQSPRLGWVIDWEWGMRAREHSPPVDALEYRPVADESGSGENPRDDGHPGHRPGDRLHWEG